MSARIMLDTEKLAAEIKLRERVAYDRGFEEGREGAAAAVCVAMLLGGISGAVITVAVNFGLRFL